MRLKGWVLGIFIGIFLSAKLPVKAIAPEKVAARFDSTSQTLNYGNLNIAQRNTAENRLKKTMADELLQQGNQQNRTSQFNEALASWEQSLKLYREIGDRQGEAASLGSLGIAYNSLGEYRKAIGFHQQSLAIKREIGDRQGKVASLVNLGNSYSLLGKYRKAIGFFQQSLAIAREIRDRQKEMGSLVSLGIVSGKVGQYGEAIGFFQQSLAIAREIGDRQGEAASLGSLGIAYDLLGEYTKAIGFHQQYLNIAREIGDRQGELNSLNNLGNSYGGLGEYKKKTGFHQQSLAIAREIGDRLGEEQSLANLGNAYDRLGEYKRAIDYHQQSLAIAREIGNRSGEVNSLGNLGNAYGRLGEYKRAIDYHQQSLAIAREIGVREEEGLILSNIGIVYEEQEQQELAIVFYKESVNVREGIRSDNQGLLRELQESYTATIAGTYRSLADLLLSQGRILEAQQVLELLKIQEIKDYTRSRDVGGQSDDVILLLEEEEIIAEHTNLINFAQKLDECAKNQCLDKQTLEKQHNRLFQAYNEAVNKLLEVFVDSSEILKPNNFSLGKFRDIVNNQPGTVLIYPFVTDERLWLLFATKQGVFTAREIADADRTQITNTVNDLRQLLEQPNSNLQKIKTSSKKLYDWLIKPIEEELETGKIQHLVFSLDSAIRYIPMAVLFDGEEFLINKYDVTTVLSAELTNYTDTLPDSVLETPVLGLGLSKAVGDFIALPHVETELDEIVKEDDEDEKGLFPGIQFLNDDFNWSNLFNKDRDQKILHIATHGKFSPVRQEDSYLMLGTGERLPVDELRTLQNGYLDETHLVVLSACQTGVSNQISGGAEINSISYYFLSGGAESVLASLWKVNDGSTSELMQRFYGYLASEPGITKATALQKAQRSFLNDSKFKHPHYWAPITLLGNGL